MNIESILLFETERVENLYPFSVLHPAWELRCGALRIFEKLERIFPDARLIYQGRENHINSFLKRFNRKNHSLKKEDMLIWNAAAVPSKKIIDRLKKAYSEFDFKEGQGKSMLFTSNGVPFAVYMPGSEMVQPSDKDKEFLLSLLGSFGSYMQRIDIEGVKFITYLWDAIDHNGSEINEDVSIFTEFTQPDASVYPAVNFVGIEKILIGKNVKIAPGVVLDASEGSIILSDNVKIMPNAVIIGPCSIGENSTVKVAAKIYEATSVGEFCKVGGEIEGTIIQAYSNKQHDGFIGHSWIGEWVNFGADTNNSDLKNTYGDISVFLRDKRVNTQRMFLGLLCGDHTKTGINSMFTTGTVCGISAILVSEWFLPSAIPSFAWGGKRNSATYLLRKAIQTAETVMSRRNKTLLPEEKILIEDEYNKLEEAGK